MLEFYEFISCFRRKLDKIKFNFEKFKTRLDTKKEKYKERKKLMRIKIIAIRNLNKENILRVFKKKNIILIIKIGINKKFAKVIERRKNKEEKKQ